VEKSHDTDVRAGASSAPNTAIGNINPESNRFDTWQELERALSLVHVAGLELVAEIETGGEQSESVARQRFEEALAEFHDVLAVLGILPGSLRLAIPSEG
jgi:hypothetical protein